MDLIALRFALYAALFAQFGIAAFGLYALRADERGSESPFRYAKTLPALAALALGLALLGIVAHLANMAGAGWWPVDGGMLSAMLGETDLGSAWVVRIAAPVAALAGSAMLRNRTSPLLALHVVCGGIAIVTLVWSGHAGATEGSIGTIHRASDIAHMLAAAIWFGGLLSFAGLLFAQDLVFDPPRLALTARALDQFARVGTLMVAMIVVTGVLNSSLTFGLANLTNLAVPYTALLAAKLLLFAAMLGCAALNRWRLAPALGRESKSPREAVSWLRRCLIVETLASLLILAVVAWLGTLPPLLA